MLPEKSDRYAVCRWCSTILAAVPLAGCAIGIPPAIRDAPTPNPTVAEIRDDAEGLIGARVRWGGTILSFENRAHRTEIEVLARPLGLDGEPQGDARAEGRFIAVVAGFIDPAEYPENRLLTVAGRLEGVEIRLVGEYPYRYPVVAADTLYLWPEPLPPAYLYSYPYPWYDPWLDPWPGSWFHPWHRSWNRRWR